MIVFGFSAAGDPFAVMRTKVSKVIQVSMHTMDILTFDEEDDDAMSMDVPFPSVWIGYEVFQSIVCSMMLLTTSQSARWTSIACCTYHLAITLQEAEVRFRT
jgi:hypothetical protein